MRNSSSYIALIAVTLVALWPVVTCDFVNYDDSSYVYNNSHVKAGLDSANVIWACTTFYFANWHPITWLSYMLDAQMFGVTAWAYHLTNLVIHTAAAVVLYAALRRMTGSVSKSLFVAAVFAVHPLHVESVAWISQRKDVLSLFFGGITLWAYAGYCEKLRPGKYLLALVAFACSLASKQTLVTLPCVLLLLDYWPLRRIAQNDQNRESSDARPDHTEVASWWRLVWEKIPFFLLSGAASAVSVIAQKSSSGLAGLETHPIGFRLANALTSYVIYLRKTLWPVDLAVFYPPPTEGILVWQWAGAAALLTVLTVAAFIARKRHPCLIVGWLWFLGTLVPMIGIVQVGEQRLADRYMYFPLIGLLIAAAWSVPAAVLKTGWRTRMIFGCALSITLGFAVLAFFQARHWKDSITLFTHALDVAEPSSIAHNSLGRALHDLGKNTEAIVQFTKAIEVNPRDSFAHNNLAVEYQRQRRWDLATQHFYEALRLNPDYLMAHRNLGILWFSRGREENNRAYFPRAQQHLAKAVALEPQDIQANGYLGCVLSVMARYKEAEPHFQVVANLTPHNAAPYDLVAKWFLQTNQIDKAVVFLERAYTTQPAAVRKRRLRTAYEVLFQDVSSRQELEEFRGQIERWRELSPDSPRAHNAYGMLLLQSEEDQLAIEAFQRAIELDPQFDEARQNLQRALDK
jgi:tetratricopeptide (TPR) repeat protein